MKKRIMAAVLAGTMLIGAISVQAANQKEVSDPWTTELTAEERREWADFLADTSWQNELNVHGTGGSASLISNPKGGTLQLGVTERPKLNDVTDQVTWSVDKNELASISNTGLVTAKQPGRVTVTASAMLDGVKKEGKVEIDILEADATYKDDFDSIVDNYEVPEWYQDAKFGIFIHWGVYSVPAVYNEWLPREMYISGTENQKRLLAKYGEDFLKTKGYKDFVPLFKAEDYNPEEWAQLFKEAGAQYVVPVAEHHDGIAMYDSDWTRWNVTEVGPKTDVMEPLMEAVRERGMKFGLSSHYIENEFFYNGARGTDYDAANSDWFDLYNNANKIEQSGAHSRAYTASHMQRWFNRSRDFIEKYNPDLVYYDFNLPGNHYTEQLLSYYYNKAEETNPDGVVVNYKFNLPDGSAVYDIERGQATAILPMTWQTDSAISVYSWGYREDDSYKPAINLINLLVDVVSKNGNLLLNIGPDSHGNIPEDAQKTLRDMGEWLKVNGEGIYGTRTWITYGEGPTVVNAGTFGETNKFTSEDIRFTVSKDGKNIYVIGMGWPESGIMEVKSMNRSNVELGALCKVSLLGSDAEITYTQDDISTKFQLPEENPNGGANPYVIKLEVNGQSTVNKVELQKKYDAYYAMEQKSYTDSSITAFREACANAKKVLDNAMATQKQVDAAVAALQKAFDGLVTKLEVPGGEHHFLRPDDFEGNLGGWTITKDEESYDGTTLRGGTDLKSYEENRDALVTISVEQAGAYDIWVHAKEMDESNNDKEAWSFKVGVNDSTLDTIFGGQQKPKRTYLWVSGGKVTLQAGENTIRLKDISRNYARCDAMFLSNNTEVLPNDYTFDEMELLQAQEHTQSLNLSVLEHQIKYSSLINLEEYQELENNKIFTESLASAGAILERAVTGNNRPSQVEIDDAAKNLHEARFGLRMRLDSERLEEFLKTLK